jgi:primosomal protein N'
MGDLEILDIIPLEKYPAATSDYFSYFAPTELGKIPLYSLVKIPIKNKIKTGFVIGKKSLEQSKLFVKKAGYQLKPIKEIIHRQPFISENQIKFAHWLKNYANISLAHTFYLLLSWQRKINTSINQNLNAEKAEKLVFRLSRRQKRQAASGVKNQSKTSTVCKTADALLLKTIDARLLKNLPTFIIVPQEEYIDHLKSLIPKSLISKTIVADLSLSSKKFQKVLEKIYQGGKNIFIGTKNSIFLPWQKLNRIIIYEEGSIFYKESFRQPFFDYMNLIKKFAEIAHIPLYKISSFLSLETFSTKDLTPPRWDNFGLIPVFNFETISNDDWKQVENLCRQHKKIIIFSPQKIAAMRVVCGKCRNEFNCPKCNTALAASQEILYCRACFYKVKIPNQCPNCQNDEFQLKGIGAEWIVRYLKKQGLNVIFAKTHQEVKTTQNKKRFIIIGSQNLLGPDIAAADLFLFVNFDRAFYSYDIFLKEKYLRMLGFLSRRAKKTILQSDLSSETMTKIKSGEILRDILEERKNQFLPPYSRMIKLISRLQNLQTLNKRMIELRKEIEKRKQDFKGRIEIWGPFLRRMPKRMSRYQLELILRIDSKINLKKLLEGMRVDEIEVDSYSMDYRLRVCSSLLPRYRE